MLAAKFPNRFRFVPAAVLLALALAGCSRENPPGNLFDNPSFENGRGDWFSLQSPAKPYWFDFEVSGGGGLADADVAGTVYSHVFRSKPTISDSSLYA